MNSDIIFHQLFEKDTSTYTYLIGDAATKEAVLIDPVIEMVDRDLNLIRDLGLNLKFILDTHVHADHVTGSGEIRKRTGAKVAVSSSYDMACPDLHLEEGQEIKFGNQTIKVIHTPGHTSGCLTYKLNNMIFTGDALLIRGCGRTDFQEGSSENLFHSVRDKLFILPDETIIYPGHDYKGVMKSTVGEEKRLNPRLKSEINKEQFVEIMSNLKLAHPKKIQEAVPANLQCGLPGGGLIFDAAIIDSLPTITPEQFLVRLGQVRLIDVRGEDEFIGELGHIPGAHLATLGPKLEERLKSENINEEIVFVCRSGKRSGEATRLAQSLGFKKPLNLQGGMLRWHELHGPVVKDMGGS